MSNNIYENNIYENNIYNNKQIVIESIIHNLIKLNDYSNKYENEMYDFLQFTFKLLKQQKSKHYIEFYNNMPYDIQDIILKNIYNNSKNIYQEMLNEFKSRNKLPPSSKFIKQVNEQEGLFKTILNLSKPLDHIIEDNVYKKFVNEVESSNIKHNELSNINEIGFEEFILKYREEIK